MPIPLVIRLSYRTQFRGRHVSKDFKVFCLSVPHRQSGVEETILIRHFPSELDVSYSSITENADGTCFPA